MRLIEALSTVASALLLLSAPARASLTVCNRTSYIIYAATATRSHNNAVTGGWTRLTPGDCRVAVGGDLSADAYYLYARGSAAHSGLPRAWGGPESFCVQEGNFSMTHPFRTRCDAKSVPAPFAIVDTHRMKSWAATLTEPGITSALVAQLAGVKRLLADNGLKTGAINGAPDKDAAASLAAFRARAHLPPKASEADLFAALETSATRLRPPRQNKPGASASRPR